MTGPGRRSGRIRARDLLPWALAIAAGCAGGREPWTGRDSAEAVIQVLDRGGDGRADREDWARVAYEAPAFEVADRDGDGALSAAEVEALTAGQDPLDWDGIPEQGPPKRQHAFGPEAEHAWEVMEFLRQEVAGDPRAAPLLPLADDVRFAAAAGSLDDPAARAVLDRIAAAHAAAGRSFDPVRFARAP